MLKGSRCETAKCPMEKQNRNRPPGMHSWRRSRGSDYAVRLREKQKVKRFYGLFEKQFRVVFARAERMKGNTGETLLSLLERRLDNVIFKMNFALSRKAARQLIAHGHVRVNGRKVDRASFMVSIGDKIAFKMAEKTSNLVKSQWEADPNAPVQHWLQADHSARTGIVVALPSRDDVQIPVEEKLIVELCSK